MQIAILGTYPPTRCGIATFTADVERALTEVGLDPIVVAIDPEPSMPHLGIPFVHSNDPLSYAAAAEWLNLSGVDLVVVEHEFGIHGGKDGVHLLEFTRRLTVPYVATLHTVLASFNVSQSGILHALLDAAAAVTVFTPTARQMLLDQKLASADTVVVVPHGAPIELYRTAGHALRDELGLSETDTVLSTFGLLSPGKGLEVAIAAMPRIVCAVPNARYVIAGRTHPGEQRHAGEAYRTELETLVHGLGLEKNVIFVDRFLNVDEIAELLSVTSVFLTPYRNEKQIVSGALTFAIAAGCPVVSTPYRYAVDMVGDGGAGLLVPFDDSRAFADAVRSMVLDGEMRERAVRSTAAVAATLSWPAVGRTLHRVLAVAYDRAACTNVATREATVALPAADHLLVLLDDTSVMQHASYRLPRLAEGYCVDDTARLLPIAARFLAQGNCSRRWATALPRLLRYLRAAALDGNGLMRNFMTWDRRWLDEPYDGDHVGRAIWGLGELVREGQCVAEASSLLQQLIDRPVDTPWPRLVAYRSLGLLAAAEHLDVELPIQEMHAQVRAWQVDSSNPGWLWPEPRLTYDVARIPEVMMRLGAHVLDDRLVDRGIACFVWLERLCRNGESYRFPGHLGLEPGGDIGQSGDEQPLEAAALIDAAVAYRNITGDPWADVVAERAWSWFLGNNRHGKPVGSVQIGACHDALTPSGVNLNCGAESSIAFHRSAHAMAGMMLLAGEVPCFNATHSTR